MPRVLEDILKFVCVCKCECHKVYNVSSFGVFMHNIWIVMSVCWCWSV